MENSLALKIFQNRFHEAIVTRHTQECYNLQLLESFLWARAPTLRVTVTLLQTTY
jgi:hypothetical protein